MKKIITILFFIFLNTLYSQRISGIILDAVTKDPIENAHIFITKKVLVTNKKGKFSFNFKKGKQIRFSVSHIKYKDQKVTFNTSENTLTILLFQKQEALSEITLVSKKNLKYKIDFTILPVLPKSTHSFAAVIKNNQLYVIGGDASNVRDELRRGISELRGSSEQEIMKLITKPKFQDFFSYLGDLQVYDFESNQWILKENVFRKKANHNVISFENKLYLLGGKRLSRTKKRDYLEDKIEVYNLSNETLEIDYTNPHQAVNSLALLYQDNIILMGGSIKENKQGIKKYSDQIHVYDLKTGYWYLFSKMTKGKESQGIVLENNLYLFGGYREKELTEIEVFDLKTNTWKAVGHLFKGMRKPAITTHKDIIYLFENQQLLMYNTTSNELRSYAIDLNLFGATMHFYKDKLYISGGYLSSEFDQIPTNGFYSVSLKEFKNTRPLKATLF
jgi:N-acetylneuraminic acid mutarotase